jgi:hypothetical protein
MGCHRVEGKQKVDGSDCFTGVEKVAGSKECSQTQARLSHLRGAVRREASLAWCEGKRRVLLFRGSNCLIAEYEQCGNHKMEGRVSAMVEVRDERELIAGLTADIRRPESCSATHESYVALS